MNLKKEYYKQGKEAFEHYLESIKKGKDTIHLFPKADETLFYCPEEEINHSLLLLHKKQWEFDNLMNSFSSFGKKQIIQSFFLSEIESTNRIEGIHSTRHDIFAAMNLLSKTKDAKIEGIIAHYRLLLDDSQIKIADLKDIRDIYDRLLLGALEKEDLPDGRFFRKDPVYVTNGIQAIHKGFYPEEKVNQGMRDFLSLYQSKMEIYLKGILSHAVLETVHPYYDGNGRLGRFLLSALIYQEEKTIFAFLISQCISQKKSQYYAALKECEDVHQFGCVNACVEKMLPIFLNGIEDAIFSLREKKRKIDTMPIADQYTKDERKILSLLKEASFLSDFGVCNQEILYETGISKRTLLYALKRFNNDGILKTTKFGRFYYHMLKVE